MGFGPTPIADEIKEWADQDFTPSWSEMYSVAQRVRTIEVAYAGNKLRLKEIEANWHGCELELFEARQGAARVVDHYREQLIEAHDRGLLNCDWWDIFELPVDTA